MDTQESQDHQPTNRVSRLLEWILGVNLLILVSLLAFALRSPYRQVDRGWEYKIEEISDSGFTDRMNVLGRQGWEMVSSRRPDDSGQSPIGYEIIFKRPVPLSK